MLLAASCRCLSSVSTDISLRYQHFQAGGTYHVDGCGSVLRVGGVLTFVLRVENGSAEVGLGSPLAYSSEAHTARDFATPPT